MGASTVTATSVFDGGSDRQQKNSVSIEAGRTPSRAERRAALTFQPGDAFNPFNLFDGAMIPSGILRSTDLSPSSKLLYARLIQFAGARGKAWPSDQTLGREVGLGERQVRRCVAELEALGLVRRIARLGRSNQFEFLWHPIYEEGRTDVTAPPRTDMTAVPRSNMSKPPRTEMSGRRESIESSSSEEIQIEKIQSSKEACLRPASPHDRSHRGHTTNHGDVRESVAERESQYNPEAEFLLRLRERHGHSVNAEAILQCVQGELARLTDLKAFLDFDEKQTTAPEMLKNPPGHYRRAVQKFYQARSRRREHEIKQQQFALEAKLHEQRRIKPKPVCSLSRCDGTGEHWNAQGLVEACGCEAGQQLSSRVLELFEQLNSQRKFQIVAASASAANSREETTTNADSN